nr:LLDR protein Lu1-17016 [Linum usitatissimum]
MRWPKYVVLKSMYNNKYLSYRDEQGEDQHGFLQFSEDDPTSRYSKFEVKRSTAEDGSVHLKCSFSKKYLARESSTSWWISASSRGKAQEDRSEWSCTLFKPIVVNGDHYKHDDNDDEKLTVVRFFHVQLNHFACLFRSGPPYGECLYAGWESPNQDLCDAVSVIDWESVTQTRIPKRVNMSNTKQVMPKFAVIKSRYNHKYLRYRNEKGEQHGFLQFSLEGDKADAVANRYAKFELKKASFGDGLVHLKCCTNNKYLMRSDATKWWIRAGADAVVEDESKWSCTLFKPVYVNYDGGIRFWHVQLRHFVSLFRSGPPFGECLYAGWKDPNQDLCDVFTVIDWEKEQDDDDDDDNEGDPSISEEEEEPVKIPPRRRPGDRFGSLSPERRGDRNKADKQMSDNEYYIHPRGQPARPAGDRRRSHSPTRHQAGRKINRDDEYEIPPRHTRWPDDRRSSRSPRRNQAGRKVNRDDEYEIPPRHTERPDDRRSSHSPRRNQAGRKNNHDDEYDIPPRNPSARSDGDRRSNRSPRRNQAGGKMNRDDEYDIPPQNPPARSDGDRRSSYSPKRHQPGRKINRDDEYDIPPRNLPARSDGDRRSSYSPKRHQPGRKINRDDEYGIHPRNPPAQSDGDRRSSNSPKRHQPGGRINRDDEYNIPPPRHTRPAGDRRSSHSPKRHDYGKRNNRDDEDFAPPRHGQRPDDRPSTSHDDGKKINSDSEAYNRGKHGEQTDRKNENYTPPQQTGGCASSLSQRRGDRNRTNQTNSDNENYTHGGHQSAPDAKGKGSVPHQYEIPKQEAEKEESDQVEFNVISTADTFWGAVFVSTKLLPKALPQVYKAIKVISPDGFSEGSIREISFTQDAGEFEKLKEKVVYVDHQTKKITWSLLEGGMLDYYERFKITISVTPKKRRDRGCRVNWSYVGINPKKKFDKDGFKKLFQDTFEAVDDYLESNAAKDTN